MADADRGSRIRDKDGVLSEPLVQRLNRRLGHLKKDRSVWEPHWRELSDHFKPRSGNWNNQTPETRGGKNSKQQVIINNTGLRAGRTLAAGMMAGLTSPARPFLPVCCRSRKSSKRTSSIGRHPSTLVEKISRTSSSFLCSR